MKLSNILSDSFIEWLYFLSHLKKLEKFVSFVKLDKQMSQC